MDKIKILVFPCGTEIGLEIHNALKYFKYIDLYGLSSVDDHGRMVYKNYINDIPFIDDEQFLEKFNEILIKNKINYVFPAHDSVVLALAKMQDRLACEVITSSYQTCDICRSKSKTYNLFPKISPKVYKNTEEVTDFPVFLKPDIGQGSQGTVKVNNKDELLFYINENKELLILEYLPGAEYTIDCFTDRHGKLLFSGMRQRIRTRNGISVNSKTMVSVDEQVANMAAVINEKLKFRGMWFFQVKLDINNNYKLLEAAPRVAGTMCLYRNNGINFSLLSVYDRLGYDVSVLNNNLSIEVDRALTNRFIVDLEYDTIYVDFDDTLIINGQVNEYLLMFLYQAVNQNKKIYLLSKHVEDINNNIEKYKIAKNLFDKIIIIDKTDEKYKYVSKKDNAILIDDSFAERKSMNENLNIPCFDLDMAESLINWKK